MGSTMYNTSKLRFLHISMKGEVYCLLGLASDVVDVALALWHPLNIVLQCGRGAARLGGVIHEELSQLCPVGGVLVDAELDVLGELLVHLLGVLCVLGHLAEELNALLHNV